MHKLQQKQIQKLKELQKVKEQQYRTLLIQTISLDQQLKEVILFAKDTFESILVKKPDQSSAPPFFLSDFTPSSISKLVFEEHLKKIKREFDKLPDSEAKLQHFLLIMMKVLFVEPSRLIKKQKQQEIMKGIVKQQNQKSGANRAISPNKKLSSPKKIKPPPNLIKQQHPPKPKPSPLAQQKPQLPSSQFDKYPFYLIALLYMFKQILSPSQTAITFTQLQKFIMGELVTSSKPTSNTEFTIQFEETKKQDFLLHDNGIRRLVFCQGLGVYLCLDVKHQMVKIYTSQLKNKQNFQPNRQKHNRKSPEILDMFYSDFGNTLGLVLGDKTIQIVNFQAFMTKLYQKQFLPFSMHQIVIKFQNPLKRIIFLQMFNKWLVVGVKNQLVLVDVSKYRSKEQQIIITPVKNQKLQLNITQILEIIPLSVVIVVAGNEIWFYDQKMSRKKYNTYVHELNISVVKYYQEKNAFYLCGDREKSLTILKPQRGRQYMQITAVAFSRPILDFELFSIFSSILLVDDKHTVRLVSEETKQVFQVQEYGRIVKDDGKESEESDQNRKKISILKLTRQSFTLYQSYMVSLSLAKVPIQTQTQFQFLPYHYFDPLKQDIYLSFNNQILCISLLQGQLRQSFTLDNSNLQPLTYFFCASGKWAPFVLDLQGKVYDLVAREGEGDGKRYKRRVEVKDVQGVVFDQQIGRVVIISPSQMYQVRNQRLNTFSTVNVTNFINFQVLSSTYLTQKKSLLLNCLSSSTPILPSQNSSHLLNSSSSKLLNTSNKSFSPQQSPKPIPQQQFCLLTSINHPNTYKAIKFRFQKIKEEDKPEVVLRCLFIEDYDVAVILTDENVVYLVEIREDSVSNRKQDSQNLQVNEKQKSKFICIKVYHFIAPKVRDLIKFNQLYVNSLKVINPDQPTSTNQPTKRPSQTSYNSLFLTSQQGFFIQINLQRILHKNFSKSTAIKKVQKNSISSLSELCQIDYMRFDQQEVQEVHLSKRQAYTFDKLQQQFIMIKAHNACKIQLIKKLQLQFLLTLTVGKDGFLKLWNHCKQCIVSLKLPTLRKQFFDIRKIQDIRGRRMMEQASAIVSNITQHIDEKHDWQQILTLTRQHELQKSYERVNQEEPIRIEIENKAVEEIVTEEPTYRTIVDPLVMIKRFKHRYGQKDQGQAARKTQGMYLKKQKSFEDILDRSRINQAHEASSLTIPVELLVLRKPLKKYQRKQQSKSIDLPNLPQSRLKRQQLLILPKLKQYKMQSRHGKHPSTERHNLPSFMDSQDSQYDTFQPCAFVKNKIQRKKGNQLDRIDKQFIRKQYSLLVKKHIARKKDAVKIANIKGPHEQKEDMDESGNHGVSLQTIVSDIKRIRYQSKFGGDRFIPKVKFKSYSQLD